MPASLPDADLAACRAMMRGGSRSFFAAARLLPRRIRGPATALYAFCRLADDLVDGGDAAAMGTSCAAVATLRARLDLAYEGAPFDHPADRAFAAAVREYGIPRGLPLALLEGFAWDVEGRRYRTLDGLLDYAARVAGSVGAMMAVLMGARSPQALARACDLGVAMQLTNIARDVGEDARAGRLYLPLDWLDEAGLDAAAFLAAPGFSPALGQVVQRLLQVAASLYAQGISGISALPLSCRPGIRAAGSIYAEIGQRLAETGHDSVAARAQVPGSRKLALLGQALLPAGSPDGYFCAPALPACQYLVDAAAADTVHARGLPPVAAAQARMDWLFDLFARLQAQQMEAS